MQRVQRCRAQRRPGALPQKQPRGVAPDYTQRSDDGGGPGKIMREQHIWLEKTVRQSFYVFHPEGQIAADCKSFRVLRMTVDFRQGASLRDHLGIPVLQCAFSDKHRFSSCGIAKRRIPPPQFRPPTHRARSQDQHQPDPQDKAGLAAALAIILSNRANYHRVNLNFFRNPIFVDKPSPNTFSSLVQEGFSSKTSGMIVNQNRRWVPPSMLILHPSESLYVTFFVSSKKALFGGRQCWHGLHPVLVVFRVSLGLSWGFQNRWRGLFPTTPFRDPHIPRKTRS